MSSKDNEIFPIYASKQKQIPIERNINLFLINSNNDNDYNLTNGTTINYHYCLVKDINRLVSNQLNRNNSKFICVRCFSHFHVKIKYDQHVEDCMINKPLVFTKTPKNCIKFEHIERLQKIPYVIYADFESIIKRYNGNQNDPNKSWTEIKGKHIASGFCVIIVDWNRNIIDAKNFIGYNAAKKFNKYIINKCDELINSGEKKITPLTKEQWRTYNSSKKCPECKQEYTFGNPKVKDHDHWTGEYHGPLCRTCNFRNKKNKFIPVFFRNLKGYDSHLRISEPKYNKTFRHKNNSIKFRKIYEF